MSIMSVTFEDWLNLLRKGKNVKRSRVKPYEFLPFVVLPCLMSIAFLSPGCTTVVMAVIAVGVVVSYAKFQKSRSQFFFAWKLASGLYLYARFECDDLLYLTHLEHLVVVLLVLGTVWCFYKTRIIAEDQDTATLPQNKNRMNCCLSRANYTYFFSGQVLSVLALLAGSNYGLTNACHSYLTVGGILWPDNCIYAFSRFLTAKIFAISAYALGLMCVILLSLVHQIVVYIPKYYLKPVLLK